MIHLFAMAFSATLGTSPDDDARAAIAVMLAAQKPAAPAAVPPVRAIHPDCACGDLCECEPCKGKCFQATLAKKQQATYAVLRQRAIDEGKALVVGINCDPPQGNWLTCRVPYEGIWTQEYYSKSVIVSVTEDGELNWKATLPFNTTADKVRDAISPRVVSPAPVQFSPVRFAPQSYAPSFSSRSC